MHPSDRDTSRSSSNSNDIRVVLADDHQLFRQGLKALLELERGITIVGEASDGLEVQRVSLEQKADQLADTIHRAFEPAKSPSGAAMKRAASTAVPILERLARDHRMATYGGDHDD